MTDRGESREPLLLDRILKQFADDLQNELGDQHSLASEFRIILEHVTRIWLTAQAASVPSSPTDDFNAGIDAAIKCVMSGRTINNFAHVPSVVRALEWVWMDLQALKKETGARPTGVPPTEEK